MMSTVVEQEPRFSLTITTKVTGLKIFLIKSFTSTRKGKMQDKTRLYAKREREGVHEGERV